MSFETYWAALCAKNPLLKTEPKLTVGVDKLRLMLEQAAIEGFQHGAAITKSLFDRVFTR